MTKNTDGKTGQKAVVAEDDAKNKMHVEIDFRSCTEAGGLVHCFSVSPVGKVGIHLTKEQFEELKKTLGV
jgi:hypothetical protein